MRPGMRVVEYTGGSTGSSLAMVCAARGYRARLVTADCFAAGEDPHDAGVRGGGRGARERRRQGDAGAVRPVQGSGSPSSPREPDTWWAEQFVNPGNAAAYRALGQEIVEELGDGIDGFVMGVGTGGCFSGVAGVLKGHNPSVRCVAVEPATSRNLSGGPLGGHRLEGIGVGFVPPGARLTSPTRSPPSPTKTRSRRRGRWLGAKGSSPGRRPAPTSSPPGGSPRSSAPAGGS